jgi:hypothetical protein
MEDRSWMYDGAGGDSLLYFKHVTQFVKAAKTHALCMNKKEIWGPCKTCENNVLWTMAETICEHLLEKGFVDNYSIWTKHGVTPSFKVKTECIPLCVSGSIFTYKVTNNEINSITSVYYNESYYRAHYKTKGSTQRNKAPHHRQMT